VSRSARGTTLTWFRTSGDSDVQVPNEKTVIIVDTKIKGNTAKNILMLKNAKKSDSGTYKCVVTFRGKQRYVMTAITVFGKSIGHSVLEKDGFKPRVFS